MEPITHYVVQVDEGHFVSKKKRVQLTCALELARRYDNKPGAQRACGHFRSRQGWRKARVMQVDSWPGGSQFTHYLE